MLTAKCTKDTRRHNLDKTRSDLLIFYFRPDVQLIEDDAQSNPADLELDEVRISNPRLDQLLQDEHWVDDATLVIKLIKAILLLLFISSDSSFQLCYLLQYNFFASFFARRVKG